MAITSIVRDLLSNYIVRVTAANTLAEVATANYITAQIPTTTALNHGLWEWQVGDMVLVSASDGDAFFTLSSDFSDFILYSTAGNGAVSLPVVSHDFTVFDGTLGALKDLGFSASDPSKTKVVMANGAVVANQIAVFTDTAGTIDDSASGVANSLTTASATPGTLRAIKGLAIGTNATMSSGNLVGVRGEVDCVGASGGFLYGVQGKVIPTGTLSGSVWVAPVFAQLDISTATVNAAQLAPVWADYGATSGTISDATGLRMFAGTNTTAATLNSHIYLYGKSSNLLELDLNGSAYVSSGGSGAPSGTIKKIAITIDGVQYYLLAATVIS